LLSEAQSRNNPVRYPWGPSPVVALQSANRGEGTWEVWNLQSMKQLGSVKGSSGADVNVSPDGQYLAIFVFDGDGSVRQSSVEVSSVADGKAVRKSHVKFGTDSTVGIVDVAGPGRLVSVQAKSGSGEARVWEVKTGEQICTFQTPPMVDRDWA